MKNSYHSTTVPAIEAVTTLRSSVLVLASSVWALWVTEPIVCVQSSVMGKGYGNGGPGRGPGVRAGRQSPDGVSSEPSTLVTRTLQSLLASPASSSDAMASRAWVTKGRGVPVDSPALTARPRYLCSSATENPPSKPRLTAALSTTPGDGYQVRSTQESPEDVEAIEWNTCGSRPSRSESTAASQVTPRMTPHIMLFTILAAWPLPASPACTTLPPSTSSRERTWSRSSAAPPTMIVSVPAAAPDTPPDTGASRKRAPALVTVSCSSRATSMSIVDSSTTRVPGLMFASTPSGAVSTSRTCSPLGSMVKTTSASRTASATLPTTWTPRSAAAAAAA